MGTFGPELIAACRKYCKTPFETQLMVSNYNSDTMLEEYVKATMGPNGEPGVVIVHVEACVHLHRTLGRIRALGGLHLWHSIHTLQQRWSSMCSTWSIMFL